MNKIIYDHGSSLVSAVLADSTNTYGVRRQDNHATIVSPGVVMTETSPGIYEYEFKNPSYDLLYEYIVKAEDPVGIYTYVPGTLEGTTLISLGSFLSKSEANQYFENRLNSQYWFDANERDQDKALLTASKNINNLQLVNFETVPQDIKDATCEQAYALLSGADPELEYENLGAISQVFANVRSTYDRSIRQEHIESGILSIIAWRLIYPYLDVSREITISRV